MRLSVALSQRLGPEVITHADAVEHLGFDGVFIFDHLIPLADPAAPALEAAAALGALAASMRTRVGSMVLRATLRPPHVTAGIAATVAAVAHQPPVIGLGSGDSLSLDETQRFGLGLPPLRARVDVLAETVAAVQAVGVTAWVGGAHPLIREVAACADGHNVWEADLDRLEELLANRPRRDGYTVSWGGRVLVGERRDDLWLSGSAASIIAKLRQVADTGVDEVVLTPLPPATLAPLGDLAEIRAQL